MSIERQFKTALDETRMLMLGAQILIGFELRSAFQERFDSLPQLSKWLEAASLLLMVLTLALLVAPSSQHRLVERGEITARIRRVVNGFADVALFPFAMALGLDFYVVVAKAYGQGAGIAAGVIVALLALAFWYVFALLYRAQLARGGVRMEHRMPGTDATLESKIEQMLTEARIALPGAQALLGFQLAVVFTRAFEHLPQTSQLVHGVAIGCIALTLILLISPAAFHRITFAGEDSERFYRLGSALVTAALLPLALGLGCDIFVMLSKIAKDPAIGIGAGALAGLVLLGFWYVQPLVLRARHGR